MRGRAILGGAALIGTVALWHRPTAESRTRAVIGGSDCVAVGAGGFCAAVAGLSRSLRDPDLPLPRADILPPQTVPGAVDHAVTQANIDRTICTPGYARSMRPSYAVTAPLKRRMMDQQHSGERAADYELDHLVPISIGGAPLDRRDLWLQPRSGQANAAAKNVLAYVLWRLVCERRLPLEAAQQAIRRDWTHAYEVYATPENVARYHFRHAGEDHERTGSLGPD